MCYWYSRLVTNLIRHSWQTPQGCRRHLHDYLGMNVNLTTSGGGTFDMILLSLRFWMTSRKRLWECLPHLRKLSPSQITSSCVPSYHCPTSIHLSHTQGYSNTCWISHHSGQISWWRWLGQTETGSKISQWYTWNSEFQLIPFLP